MHEKEPDYIFPSSFGLVTWIYTEEQDGCAVIKVYILARAWTFQQSNIQHSTIVTLAERSPMIVGWEDLHFQNTVYVWLKE